MSIALLIPVSETSAGLPASYHITANVRLLTLCSFVDEAVHG